jgi:REP element-mobilizing transposase RayT
MDSHNMWDYVYFLIYIEQKRATELSGDESYVLNHYLKKKLDWVPSKR